MAVALADAPVQPLEMGELTPAYCNCSVTEELVSHRSLGNVEG